MGRMIARRVLRLLQRVAVATHRDPNSLDDLCKVARECIKEVLPGCDKGSTKKRAKKKPAKKKAKKKSTKKKSTKKRR
jgi:hypothetical protein